MLFVLNYGILLKKYIIDIMAWLCTMEEVGNQEQSGRHSDRTDIKMVTKLIRRLKNIFEKKLGVRLSG
jgi:hypothetical protein